MTHRQQNEEAIKLLTAVMDSGQYPIGSQTYKSLALAVSALIGQIVEIDAKMPDEDLS